jgi:hypothetical protein
MKRTLLGRCLVFGAGITLALAAACHDAPSVLTPKGEAIAAPDAASRVMAAATQGAVRMEAHFTDMRGGATQDMTILNHVIYLIDGAPAGSTMPSPRTCRRTWTADRARGSAGA